MTQDAPDEGWATRPQDTRERTCEWAAGPLSVLHTLRVARHPDPRSVTVTRTHEATVEWTADPNLGLPGWLRALAESFPPYEADRFGHPRDGDGDGDAEGSETDCPGGACADGRFRAAPVDATVRPTGDGQVGLSDPYHYWNTPLARLLADDGYPAGVGSLTLDLLEGPTAVWTAGSTAGVDPHSLPGDPTDYDRVGLEFTGRERFRRPVADRECDPGGEGDDPGDRWTRAGDPAPPATGPLGRVVAATLADPVDGRGDGSGATEAVAAVEDRIAAVWRAFRREAGDPYAIPDEAVETATSGIGP